MIVKIKRKGKVEGAYVPVTDRFTTGTLFGAGIAADDARQVVRRVQRNRGGHCVSVAAIGGGAAFEIGVDLEVLRRRILNQVKQTESDYKYS